MNLSITNSRAVVSILDEGRLPVRAKAAANDVVADEPSVHCTEKPWRSTWHERMDGEERAYDEVAFRDGEPLDFERHAS